jgi:hypothetical protein
MIEAVTLIPFGNQGLQGGWVINDGGGVNFPHALQNQLALMQEAAAGWVRMGFRLGSCYSDWTSNGCNGVTALQQYDQVVSTAQSLGLKIIGLINNESWTGNQAAWTANNAEHSGGNGDNAYLQALSLHVAVVLATHYAGTITAWEVWNEPNAWTSSPSPGVYTGGSYLYPSNFAWLLRHFYEDTRNAGVTGLTFVSGGMLGHDIGGSFSSGSDYITAMYNQGLAKAGWSSVKQTLGSYPLDAIGQHLYIDQGRTTSTSKITNYLNAIRQAYVAFEGSATPKNTVVTEFGWTTAAVSQSVQANNLQLAYTAFKEATYVKNAYWFNIQDVPEANQSFGLQTGGTASDQYQGEHKPSFASYQQYAVNWPTSVSTQKADSAPVLIIFNETMYVGWTGRNKNHNLNLMTYNPSSQTFGPAQELTDTTLLGSGPSLTVFNGNLYVAWLGTNHRLNIGRYNPADPTHLANKVTLSELSNQAPSIAVFNGRLYLSWRGTDGRLNIISSADASTFDTKVTCSATVRTSPTLQTANAVLFVAWEDTSASSNIVFAQYNAADPAVLNAVVTTTATSTLPVSLFPTGVPAQDLIVAWRTATDAHINLAIYEGDQNLHNQVSTAHTTPYGPALYMPYVSWTGTDAAQSINVGQ